MLRNSSSVESVLTYATFLALSIAFHMVVILGTRQPPAKAPGHQAAATRTHTSGAR